MTKIKTPGLERRGYFGVGVENLKNNCNLGTLFRSAFSFGADFLYVTGRRYKRQSSDTVAADRHLPFFEFEDFEDMYNHQPKGAQLIGVETREYAEKYNNNVHCLDNFVHPEKAVYLFGSEDGGLSKIALERCLYVLYVPTFNSINVGCCASIVIAHRREQQRNLRNGKLQRKEFGAHRRIF